MPSALEAQSLNRWTTREIPSIPSVLLPQLNHLVFLFFYSFAHRALVLLPWEDRTALSFMVCQIHTSLHSKMLSKPDSW